MSALQAHVENMILTKPFSGPDLLGVIEAPKWYPLVVHPNFFKSAKMALCAHIRSAEDLMPTDGESLMGSIDDFRSKLATDSAFAAAVKACSTPDAIVNAAKDAGIDLSHNDLAKAIAAGSPNLTDEDLESVSSGTIMAAALVK
ncbi:putative ribosomally synthesized peptide with nif11-like leader [Sinorhizobium meliloti]|nr:Nif11-like leader peptide family natural product precursor [Sinorhizobium meliloti]MBP2470696.1 putative ribosomally synthesized peptide with nif11-like leader [Sinorhizobium meliloti]MDE4598055.1 Nif11-like leader peptide family natural product precursor [Sinorhizobium meliloti]